MRQKTLFAFGLSSDPAPQKKVPPCDRYVAKVDGKDAIVELYRVPGSGRMLCIEVNSQAVFSCDRVKLIRRATVTERIVPLPTP